MELNEVFKKRRSVRHYERQKVDHSLIEDLISAAQKAPVSCNLQLTQYIVVDDENLLSKLGDEVSYKFKYAPTVVVILVDNRFTVERQSAVMSAGMAVENILLRAVELGLSTCPMAGFEKDEIVKNILNIPEFMDIVLLVTVGYKDQSIEQEDVPRLSSNEVFRFNSYKDLKTLEPSNKLKDHTPKSIIDYRRRIAPVYLDRFRLNSFNGKYYDTVVNEIEKFLLSKSHSSWLDILSYDGEFLRQIYEKGFAGNYEIWSSDYLSSNLNFFSKKFGYQTSLIDEENKIVSDKKFDFISYVFQLDFTPEREKLLKSVIEKLENNGHLLIAVIRNRWYKEIILFLKKLWRGVKGRPNNIYEGNTYYKIGPYSESNLNNTKSVLSKSGINLLEEKSFRFNKNGTIVRIFIFEKKLTE